MINGGTSPGNQDSTVNTQLNSIYKGNENLGIVDNDGVTTMHASEKRGSVNKIQSPPGNKVNRGFMFNSAAAVDQPIQDKFARSSGASKSMQGSAFQQNSNIRSKSRITDNTLRL